MAFKETVKQMKDLLQNITQDLEKADAGNKAASQRVRTGTVKLEKIAKLYRKESIKSEKQVKVTKKPAAKKSAAATASKPAAKKGASSAAAKPKDTKVKAKPKAKMHKAVASPRAMSFKKPTAKLPNKRASMR